ncbi:heparinase II/III family protein [Sphingomonas jatrophae]|uniref:Uncharacterized conserved protein, heparinase superfamily n=1 Tax=Sphingomonas jatrophae TaxID=1166337 RepID=A0A1I6MBL6_9SPHN|nr:heparinase II/III family protein [Sphingomonas jatrophae]SFS13007.1 Uncharacterized conserved protein, heparinase superfamily [Sphingomonas jatrophae]
MTAERPVDGIEPGRRLIRVESERGLSLAERLTNQLARLSWRTPLHAVRLRGRYPLKLLGVPEDPLPGSAAAGREMLAGSIAHRGETTEIEPLDFARMPGSAAFADHLQSFAWLRDLAAATDRVKGAPIAELLMRRWLAAHGSTVADAAWRPDLWGRRILFWGAYAPYILSSTDIVYRSAVLNGLARGARHLDRSADKAPLGLPRIAAWAGVIAAGLLIPGGDGRVAHGEAGLGRTLGLALYADGGLTSRSPLDQIEAIELLAMLAQVYAVRRREPAAAIAQALARAVPALLGVTLGDGGLSSWQGGAPLRAARVAAAVTASGVRGRPLRQARDWGYQRLSAVQTLLVLDAAPPPIARGAGGCASTLAFELSDGPHRLIVNCGGAGGGMALPAELAQALRATAAHSTLVLADANSTAIHADGSLGRGVSEVELDRQELEAGSRLEVSHDGYVRRHGLIHRRNLLLAADGRELKGEDILLPSGRRRATDLPFAIRFHLAPGVEASATADGLGALLRITEGALWQFRCRGGTLSVEESLWVDPTGRPRGTSQLVVTGMSPAGGASVGWVLKRAG